MFDYKRMEKEFFFTNERKKIMNEIVKKKLKIRIYYNKKIEKSEIEIEVFRIDI